MLKQFNLIFLTFIISSCAVSFEELKLSSINIDQEYFNSKQIIIQSTIPLKKSSIEEITTLNKDGSVIDIDLTVDNNTIYIIPSEDWSNGSDYKLIINGTLQTTDGRNYETYFSKSFTYGIKGQHFSITDVSLPASKGTDKIIITFNSPVDINSFEKAFSISPYIEVIKEYSENNDRIEITPASSWAYNSVYSIKLKNIKSEAGYILEHDYDNNFLIPANIQTELLSINVCSPVNIYTNDFTEEPAVFKGNLITNLCTTDSLSFTFNSDILYDSFTSNFTISPSVQGKIIKNNRTFYFIPSTPFKDGTEYLITFNQNIKNTENLTLYNKIKYSFIPTSKKLIINNLSINETTDIPLYKKIKNDCVITHIEISKLKKAFILISFNLPLADNSISKIDKAVQISPYFPSSNTTPHLLSVNTMNNNKTLILEYDNFTSSSEGMNIYKINIDCNSQFLFSEHKNFMEENLCTLIYAD